MEKDENRHSSIPDDPKHSADGHNVDPDFEELHPPTELSSVDETSSSDNGHPVKKSSSEYRSIYGIELDADGNPKLILPVNNIKVKIVSYIRKTTNMIRANPNLYMIEVEHLNHKWTLRRRYKHFQHLHNQLQLLRTSLNIPFPSKSHRQRRESFRFERSRGKAIKEKKVPRFPLRPEALISTDQMADRMAELEDYLNGVLENIVYRNHHETLSFLEISRLSFVDVLGEKKKEGWLKKRSGSNSSIRYNIYCREDDGEPCCCCYVIFCQSVGRTTGVWSRRWIFVKDTFVGYIRAKTDEIGCVLLMDQDFKVRIGKSQTGLDKGLIVSNSSRQLFVKNWTKREAQEWLDCIQQTMDATGRDFIHTNPFGSFVPKRKNNKCGWYVDGSSFMSSVADALESATEEIMIADWWLSPEIYMKRPVFEGNKWRLDTILKRKAEQGIKVFVLLYKEVELALGINSFYSKKVLSLLHPNIKVLRHPDHVAGTGTVLWAHHEKLVIIDQSIAFVGGIDLCYGRWDDEKHRLTDLGSVGASTNRPVGVMTAQIQTSHTRGQQAPGALFHLAKTANQVTLGTVSVEPNLKLDESSENKGKKIQFVQTDTLAPPQEKQATVNRKSPVGKLRRITYRGREWAEELKGDGKGWVEKHFSRNRDKGSEIDLQEEISSEGTSFDELDGSAPSQQVDESKMKKKENYVQEALTAFEGSTKLWIGKDYTNCIVKDFVSLDKPLQDFVDRTTTPRLPWHDIGCVVWGEAGRDVARHFIQRWNAIKVEKVKGDTNYPFIVPKSYNYGSYYVPRFEMRENKSTLVDCQVLRSSSTWSVGSRITEDSIQKAYIRAIKDSQHYIYIENQFFISLVGNSEEVSNEIAQAIYERILLAYKSRTCFRVIVILPLLPGFEGQIGTNTGVAMQAILHWNYASISRGSHSLLGKLREEKIDPLNYISFYGLRTHSELNQQLVTELIYVHSKLMIVDDKTVICGSANINDRSMLGKRDSEMALIIQDNEFVDSVMDKQPYRAGKFALSLRKRLFREHLGLLRTENDPDMNIDDPIADSFYKETWIRTAALNTKIYEEVFRCLPCDEVTSFSKLKEFQACLPMAMTEPTIAQGKLSSIRGHLVLLPLNFLVDENLSPAAGTAEVFLPTSLWV